MSFFSKIKKILLIVVNPHLAANKRKHIFLISHMRSRSSVLSHIIGSNSNVCGYSELHRSYLNKFDLLKTRLDLFNDLPNNGQRSELFFDKILHNKYALSNKLIIDTKPLVVILLREPEATIKSIINMCKIVKSDDYMTPEKALEHYCDRLIYLENYAKKNTGNYYFIESDDLISDTDLVLSRLTMWLKIKEPLMKEYTTFENTGKPGHGDPSNKIKTGVIVKTKGYDDIIISEQVLLKATHVYEQCKSSLINNSYRQ